MLAPSPAGRIDVGEPDIRFVPVPDPPLLFVFAPGIADLIGLELLVQRIQRIDAEVVHVQHHAKAQLVGPLQERLQRGKRRVVPG